MTDAILSPVPLGQQTPTELASPFTISTWNVWFDKHHREDRFIALLALLETHDPHIMAFQEVTPPFVRAVQANDWLRRGNHWISATDHNNLGTVLIARVRPVEVRWLTLPTSMGRRLLVADFPDGLRIGVCHLESLANEDLRGKQLTTSLDHLGHAPHALMLGDFNFGDGTPEASAIQSPFVDAWTNLHPGLPGFTYDAHANPMARHGASQKQERLDRMLCKNLSVSSIELLGTNPIADSLFASDHFGLLARCTFSGLASDEVLSSF